MISNTKSGYGWLAITFHWITALTVFGLFGVGLWMVELNYYSEWYRIVPHYHKSVGLTLAALTVARILWKLYQPKPAPLGTKVENRLAHLAHIVLYLLMFAMFTSGYLISTADGRGIDVFNWFTLPSAGELFENQEDVAGDIHLYLAYSLIGLVAIHALAALKHHLFNRDTTLVRMLTSKFAKTNLEQEERL